MIVLLAIKRLLGVEKEYHCTKNLKSYMKCRGKEAAYGRKVIHAKHSLVLMHGSY